MRERPHELGNWRRCCRIRISAELRHLSRTRAARRVVDISAQFHSLAHTRTSSSRSTERQREKRQKVCTCGANPASSVMQTFWLHGMLGRRHARRADNNNGNGGAAPRLCNVLHHQHYVCDCRVFGGGRRVHQDSRSRTQSQKSVRKICDMKLKVVDGTLKGVSSRQLSWCFAFWAKKIVSTQDYLVLK